MSQDLARMRGTLHRLGGGRARVVWLDGGVSEGDPREAKACHGFNGVDAQVVRVVSGFAAR